MFKKLFALILFLVCIYNAYGKDSTLKAFDRRLDEVINDLIVSNTSKAHKVGDSLMRAATGDEQRIKAHMLLARLYEDAGDLQNSLQNALKADTIANAVMNYSWQANTSFFCQQLIDV